MKQRVKLHVTSDLEDVPNFLSHCLKEAAEHIERSLKMCDELCDAVRNTSAEHKDSMKELIAVLDSCRTEMIKGDMRLIDVGNIMTGLASLDENSSDPSDDTETTPVVQQSDAE